MHKRFWTSYFGDAALTFQDQPTMAGFDARPLMDIPTPAELAAYERERVRYTSETRRAAACRVGSDPGARWNSNAPSSRNRKEELRQEQRSTVGTRAPVGYPTTRIGRRAVETNPARRSLPSPRIANQANKAPQSHERKPTERTTEIMFGAIETRRMAVADNNNNGAPSTRPPYFSAVFPTLFCAVSRWSGATAHAVEGDRSWVDAISDLVRRLGRGEGHAQPRLPGNVGPDRRDSRSCAKNSAPTTIRPKRNCRKTGHRFTSTPRRWR